MVLLILPMWVFLLRMRFLVVFVSRLIGLMILIFLLNLLLVLIEILFLFKLLLIGNLLLDVFAGTEHFMFTEFWFLFWFISIKFIIVFHHHIQFFLLLSLLVCQIASLFPRNIWQHILRQRQCHKPLFQDLIFHFYTSVLLPQPQNHLILLLHLLL